MKHLEQDLYEPVRLFFAKSGCTVRGEVGACDLVACTKDQALMAVELKLVLNLAVILQATQRQRMFSDVWIAVARSGKAQTGRRYQQLLHLLRRLELGLLIVDLEKPSRPVSVVLVPQMVDRSQLIRSNKARMLKLKHEFEGRHGDHNRGGSTKVPRVTVYREQALRVAALMADCDDVTASQLKALGAPEQTWNILYDNHYQWFERLGSGRYRLSANGVQALEQYAGLVAELHEQPEEPEKKQFRGTTPGTVPKLEEKSMKEGG